MNTFKNLLNKEIIKFKGTKNIVWSYEMLKAFISEQEDTYPDAEFIAIGKQLLNLYNKTPNAASVPLSVKFIVAYIKAIEGDHPDVAAEFKKSLINFKGTTNAALQRFKPSNVKRTIPIVDEEPAPPAIGDFYEGGVIFYINGPTVLATQVANTSDAAPWSLTDTVTGATDTAIGSGLANTNLIVADQGAGTYVAKLCQDVTDGGNNDWYMPSKDELNEMYLNKTTIDATSIANGGVILDGFYWSSTEIDNIAVWGHLFANGSQYSLNKSDTHGVRAIRNVTL